MYIKLVSVLTAVLFLLSCQQEGDDKEKEQPESGNTEQQYDPPTESDKAERPPNQQQNQPQGQMPMQQQGQNIDVSDEDLKKFAEIIQEVQVINQSSQQDMMKAVQDEGLDVQKFTQIQQAQQNPNKEANASDKEMKQFQSSMEQIQKIQTDSRAEIESKIEERGMSIEEYQKILSAIQQSPELQQKFQNLQQNSQNNDSK